MTVTEAIIDVSLSMGIFEPNFETLKMYNTVLSRFFTSPNRLPDQAQRDDGKRVHPGT